MNYLNFQNGVLTSMALSHTFVLNLKLERLYLAKKILKDCGSSTRPRVTPKEFPYTAFYDWFKNTQKKVVSVEVDGSIMVTIITREGLCLQKKGLDYQGAENTGKESGYELHDMRCKKQHTPLEGMDNEQINRFALFLFEENQNKSKQLDEMIVRLSLHSVIYNTFIGTCKQTGISFRDFLCRLL